MDGKGTDQMDARRTASYDFNRKGLNSQVPIERVELPARGF